MKRICFLLITFVITQTFYSATARSAAADARTEAINKIDKLISTYPNYAQNLKELRLLALAASHNFLSIADIARITTEVHYHTLLLIDIAKIASETRHDCDCFTDIAVLAVLKLSESSKVMALARQAKEATSSSDMRKVSSAMKRLRNEAELKTYDEAIHRQ